jgi:pimeloyl-ACP methyl ester carboxylesterase
VLEPDNYVRHNPQDVRQMIEVHGPKHGQDYWRELLTMTMKEIISYPNYTQEMLAKVTRPVFVIMGAEDKVNAPDRHAQFIADNVPEAELWIPAKTGHNVHMEHPYEWVARVLDFLHRRGSNEN